MVPGTGHCGGGPGPSKFDSLEQTDTWVATNGAPQRIVAEHFDKAGSVDRTRPICRYPQQPLDKGSGSTDDAAVNAGIKGDHFRRFSRVPGEAGASDEHTKAQAAEV